MRRNEREISDSKTITDIITKTKICYLGLSDNNQPYVVPMNFGYDSKNNALYLHSAGSGKKLDLIKKNNQVCFALATDIEVIIGEQACKSTAHYQSIIGFGRAFLVTNDQEKIIGLNILMAHQGWLHHNNSIDYGKSLAAVEVIKIAIDSITGKANLG